MPAAVISIPEGVITELKELDSDYDCGDLTKKGYCKKKWKLLQPHVESKLITQVEKLQAQLEATDLSEDDYYNRMIELLKEPEASKNDKGNPDSDSSVDEREICNIIGTVPDLNSIESPKPGTSSAKTPKSSRKSLSTSKAKKKLEAAPRESEVIRLEEKMDTSTDSPKPSSTEIPNGSSEKRKANDVKDEPLEIEPALENNAGKKIKLSKKSASDEEESEVNDKPSITKAIKPAPKKCEFCRQLLDDNADLIMYQGHPNNAVEEFVALTDPKLSLFTGEEAEIHSHDERPQNKITYFTVYDKAGHLCPIDSGLVERNVLLFFSGYLKAVYEEDTSPEGGIPVMEMGPINEWWFSGFDGGEKALIGFSTPYGEYYLMEPSPDYEPFMKVLREKIYLGKLVIEFLLDEENPSYEDLLNQIQTSLPPPGLPKLTEDSLLRHAQFICDQVLSFDSASESEESSLVTTPCIRALIHLAGVTFGKRQAMRRAEKKEFKVKKPSWTKATTTPLVQTIFETFFPEQLDNEKSDDKGPRRRRCGVCEACQLADCGTCISCVDMVKFGGSGRSKQACVKRRCPNMAVQEADDSEPEDEDSYQQAAEEMAKADAKPHKTRVGSGKKQVDWVGDKVHDDGRRIFYKAAKVGDIVVRNGDCVSVEPVNPSSPVVVGRIAYMWQNQFSQKFMHVQWFFRSSETVLGETGDPQELFLVDDCENSLLSGITGKVKIIQKTPSKDWKWDGGKSASESSDIVIPDDGKTFYYQKRYDEILGRFEDPLPDPECTKKSIEHRFCVSCERLYQNQKFETPFPDEMIKEEGSEKNSSEVQYALVRWRGEEYHVGCCVFLNPTVFKFKNHTLSSQKPSKTKSGKIDEELYPEHYRKSSDRVKGSNETTPEPFCIGLVTSISSTSPDLPAACDIRLKVVKFYRPENTVGITTQPHQLDLNMLYCSEEETTVYFSDVRGKCVVVYSENLVDDVFKWSLSGPNRFYFTESYDPKKMTKTEPSKRMKQLGNVGKGKGKGKGSVKIEKKKIEAENWPSISEPLKCLDVFAGCGGLSEGLHQAGVAEAKWAIEKEEPAVNAFKLNNPDTVVLNEDCNYILKLVMNGKEKSDKGQKLPQKGEVELLCGGPPCQGFSGMNRFNSRQYSLFKNSLIVSYLSYCDYYRPRFFILENVRNFVSFKRSMVLKLTLRCLIKMGYQVTFGVLQAGNYGVPQTRRRAIILAAAPGEKLPTFPEPTHVFNPRATQLTIMVDDKKFISNCQWADSAPYRTITVRDAMSDLPEIPNGASQDVMPYSGEPMSHFQKLMRGDQYQAMLKDHICKEMAPIVEARMAHIPIASGSDWRDLPNIVVRLCDGNYTKKLQYTHHDKKNGKSSTGALRGVCSCATGKPCDPMDKQFNTLIPWCLPHTGNRHNHWAGLYGRLEWDGFFSTTVTNPEPMGKQGRVLHPEQTRVVSVRECARSQGFPDKYRFYGNILDKHRQVGNAVPPPMGAAIGREIRKCIHLYEEEKKSTTKDVKMEVDNK